MSVHTPDSGKTSLSRTPTGPTFSAGFETILPTPPASDEDVVESPSVSSSNALARFEFESGRSIDGTKILMVEWEDDDTTKGISGDWAISWESKRTVLPGKDVADGGVNRLYFLLPAGERIPATITLSLSGTTRSQEKKDIVWQTNPLPAIFPPELGASAREAGKKGVLHTIWAKKRLQVLSKEIDAESKNNVEGVALLMAIQEREWIEQNFGITRKATNIAIPSSATHLSPSDAFHASSLSPTSPRSPGGGRLMDKLKGLRLETQNSTTSDDSNFNPLSPEQSDVAVSSFGSFVKLKGLSPVSSLTAKPAQSVRSPPQLHAPSPPSHQKRVVFHQPPASIVQQQNRSMGMASLNAFTGGHTSGFSTEDEKEDDLFALPMSPRSPEMSKSPFSFGAEETLRYFRGERV